jgi:hypothetical protein
MLWPGSVAQAETGSEIVWRFVRHFVLGFQVVIDFSGAEGAFLGDVCEVCEVCASCMLGAKIYPIAKVLFAYTNGRF